MIAVLGYNFCSDRNAIDPMPTNVSHITKTRIENGIYDHFNVTSNTSKSYNVWAAVICAIVAALYIILW